MGKDKRAGLLLAQKKSERRATKVVFSEEKQLPVAKQGTVNRIIGSIRSAFKQNVEPGGAYTD